MSWAKPGVKVVCIDASPNRYGDSCGLVLRGIYTVKGKSKTDGYGVKGVFLEEVDAPYSFAGYGFKVSRFRPLVTKTQEQDVAKFRHLLTPSPIDAGLVPAGVELDA